MFVRLYLVLLGLFSFGSIVFVCRAQLFEANMTYLGACIMGLLNCKEKKEQHSHGMMVCPFQDPHNAASIH